MTRRRKQSPAEDVINLVALVPWWVSVVLALISYLSLHIYAAQPVAIDPSRVRETLGQAFSA